MNAAAATVLHLPRKCCSVFWASALAFLVSGAVNPVEAATILSDCSEASLRTAIAQGGKVVLACDGTITLTEALAITVDTLLDATGHQFVLSGGHDVRVFDISTNVELSLVNLSVVEGRSTNGGAILNRGGVVDATNCAFSGNEAAQAPITAGQPPPLAPAPSQGGAICNLGGTVSLDGCVFTGNSATGAPDSLIAFAPGGDALGGAIYSDGHLQAHACTFHRNSAMGGSGGDGVFFPGSFGIGGGSGGLARGGAICNLGSTAIDRSLFASNSATGGQAGNGGSAGNFPPAVGAGQNGGNGGYASGAALFNAGAAALINSTFAGGVGTGGVGGRGGVGSDFWWQGVHYQFGSGMDGLLGKGCGGLWNASGAKLYVTNCTIAFNSGSAGNGEAAIIGDDIRLVNTLLATNSPNNGTNVLIDLGHNLSSDASCSFDAPGSWNNTDPLISSLADNGGPTLTIALRLNSPAIDAGDPVSAPSTDQRGFVRPVGEGPDIGAFELSATPPIILASPKSQIAAIGTTANFGV